jgi:hypothetical protein
MAVQRNPRIDMRTGALYAEAAYVFAKARWTPTLSYTYAAFGGDDPETSRYERFDPLYYGGSLYYLRPSALIFNLRMDPFEQHGGQKADDIAMRLGVAWGGQVQDAVNAHLQSLKQFPPRQKGGSLRIAGD